MPLSYVLGINKFLFFAPEVFQAKPAVEEKLY